MHDAARSQLLERMRELKNLYGLIGLATWDQETYLPPRASGARASQLATLQGLYHERLVSPALGELLEQALEDERLGADPRAMARVLRHERNREMGVPLALVQALAEAQSHAISAWRVAREARSFALFQPRLARLLELRREQADAIGHGGDRYDALLDGYEPGMTTARLSPVLEALKAQLVPMVQRLREAPAGPSTDVLAGGRFDPERQWRFTLRLLSDMGFDLEAGRQDQSIHPFSQGIHASDVRLTTRLDEATPLTAIFSTLHEGGHGLYEQGFSPEHDGTPLSAAPSMGLHESQSRLWENLVGRSRPFWSHYLPVLQAAFPEALGRVPLDDFYAAINGVQPSLIRAEADEVTYNLHIILRYELELLLAEDELPLDQLPSEWSARSEALLGIRPPDDRQGVLQDIHWAWGELGYFPTYALGNLYSASLFEAARRALPGLEAQVGRGQLLPLRDWLRANVYAEGFRYPAEELIRRVTGRGLTDRDFIAYLKSKYSALYGVSL